jgi:hypothetical protein
MDKLEQESRRGHRAEAVLGDDLFAEAKEHIEQELFRLFKTVPPTDVDALQQIKSMQYMHDKYIAFLRKAVRDGKLARMEIEERKKRGLIERVLGN